MDLFCDKLVFNYNPFEDIQQNRETIWRLDAFEETLPPLITDEDMTNIEDIHYSFEDISNQTMDQTIDNSFKYYSETMTTNQTSITCLESLRPMDPIDGQIYDSFASGDCQELWRLASVPQMVSQKETQTKKKDKIRVNSLHSKPNLIRFPEKLWKIINECNSGAIQWSADGKSILINYFLFQNQYLMDFKHFKTKNVSSFVRQLNLYGFHKLGQKTKRRTNSYTSPSIGMSTIYEFDGQNLTLNLSPNTTLVFEDNPNELHEFRCEYFRRDNKQLLESIQRKYPNNRNDENSDQLIKKKAKSERKPLKPLNTNKKLKQKTPKESKSNLKKQRKQLIEENITSNEYKNGVNSVPNIDLFGRYSIGMIFPENSDKMFSESIDKSYETVIPYEPNDYLF